MSSKLLIDLGNTRLKWALTNSGALNMQALLIKQRQIETLLDESWAAFPTPAAVVLVSVAESATTESVAAWIKKRWGISAYRVHAARELLGVRSSYHEPARLGADRWAALLGARAEVRAGACVIDCGTAVTVDALTKEGEFAGGVILPGLSLMRSSLARGTAGVKFEDGNEVSCLARSTDDAVAAGTVYGLAGAIERVAREFEQSLDEPLELLITGGDADRIAGRLTRPARRIPDLVLRGAARIAETLP